MNTEDSPLPARHGHASSSRAVRLHTTSASGDPGSLVPGRDLVLNLDAVHGTEAPEGTYVFDFLDPESRHAADRAALGALEQWQARFREPLTLIDVCWPWVWTLPLYQILNPAVSRALALRRALGELGAQTLELVDTDPGSACLAVAVGQHLGLDVTTSPGARPPATGSSLPPPVARHRVARHAAVRWLTRFGVPSFLRPGCVAVHAYWPLMPMLDRMLREDGHRPAVFLEKRPTGVARSLRAAVRGGWLGRPTIADRRRARAHAARVAAAVGGDHPLEVDGLELGAWLHPRLAAVAERRAAEDLAEAAMLRRVLRSGRPRWVVGAYDIDARARLIVMIAQESGVRTLMLCHGAYLLPQPLADLDLCDEVALWSYHVAPPITNWERPIHVVGYPLPHQAPAATRSVRPGPPRIAVLAQGAVRSTCVLDERITMRCYEIPVRAIARRFPDATVVLRPRPGHDRAASPALRERFPGLDLREETGGDIVDFLASVDLCIGGASTATLEGALAGTPVIALNLSGSEWPFPIGGATSVPVARSAEDLEAILDDWARAGTLPGREDLLTALGADGSDAVSRLLAILDGATPPATASAGHG